MSGWFRLISVFCCFLYRERVVMNACLIFIEKRRRVWCFLNLILLLSINLCVIPSKNRLNTVSKAIAFLWNELSIHMCCCVNLYMYIILWIFNLVEIAWDFTRESRVNHEYLREALGHIRNSSLSTTYVLLEHSLHCSYERDSYVVWNTEMLANVVGETGYRIDALISTYTYCCCFLFSSRLLH